MMKIPLVKEWGSWVVFGASCLTAVAAASSTQPLKAESGGAGAVLATIAGLFFLINTKPSLLSAVRAKGPRGTHLTWFILFAAAGLLLLVPFLRTGISRFAPFLILPAAYLVLVWNGWEHRVYTELTGFALLTAASPVVYFVMTGVVSMKLYIAVLLYFAAGVLKVRVRMKKTPFYRILMVVYCAAVLYMYTFLHINVVLLVPLSENIISAVWMREEKLKTTGNIELAKSILFVFLAGSYWTL